MPLLSDRRPTSSRNLLQSATEIGSVHLVVAFADCLSAGHPTLGRPSFRCPFLGIPNAYPNGRYGARYRGHVATATRVAVEFR